MVFWIREARWAGAAAFVLSGQFLAAAALKYHQGAVAQDPSPDPAPPASDPSPDSVPFYMYELPQNASAVCPPGALFRTNKMFPDWAMHVGLRDHPWRTLDPSKAMLFYMPAHLSAIVWSSVRQELDPCWRYERSQVTRMAEHVLSSEYFIRNGGRDHFTTAHHFIVTSDVVEDLFGELAAQLIGKIRLLTDDLQTTRQFHQKERKRRVTTPYADVYHYQPAPAQIPFWTRNNSMIFVGKADKRYGYHARVRSFALSAWFAKAVLICVGDCAPVNPHFDVCGARSSKRSRFNGCVSHDHKDFDYRSLLRDSKFGLFFRGDTASSSRLYDYVASGVVPIIVSDENAPFDPLAVPFKEDIPWDNFSFTIPQQEFMTNLKASVSRIVYANDSIIDEKLKVLDEVRSSLTWVSDGYQSRVPSLVLRKVARDAGLPVAPADHRALPAVSMLKLSDRGVSWTPRSNASLQPNKSASAPSRSANQLIKSASPKAAGGDKASASQLNKSGPLHPPAWRRRWEEKREAASASRRHESASPGVASDIQSKEFASPEGAPPQPVEERSPEAASDSQSNESASPEAMALGSLLSRRSAAEWDAEFWDE